MSGGVFAFSAYLIWESLVPGNLDAGKYWSGESWCRKILEPGTLVPEDFRAGKFWSWNILVPGSIWRILRPGRIWWLCVNYFKEIPKKHSQLKVLVPEDFGAGKLWCRKTLEPGNLGAGKSWSREILVPEDFGAGIFWWIFWWGVIW